MEDAKGIMTDIELFLQEAKNQNKKVHDNIQNEKVPQSILFQQEGDD